jgi:hypothetical protein
MKSFPKQCCESMSYYLQLSDAPVEFIPRFREYGFPCPDNGRSMITIEHCPWCGEKLPTSLRERWFDELDALGIDEAKDSIPEHFQTDEWYSSKQHQSVALLEKSNIDPANGGAIPRRVLKDIP